MDDLNKPETEEDSKLAWERRRYRALQSSKGQPVLTPTLLQSQNSTPEITSELTSRNDLAAHHVYEVAGQLNKS
jgi:hypothetical protein